MHNSKDKTDLVGGVVKRSLRSCVSISILVHIQRLVHIEKIERKTKNVKPYIFIF